MGGAKIFCRREMRISLKKEKGGKKGKMKFVLPRRIITRPSRCAGLVLIRSELYPNYCL
jgi:hypothetical protein